METILVGLIFSNQLEGNGANSAICSARGAYATTASTLSGSLSVSIIEPACSRMPDWINPVRVRAAIST